MEIQKLAASKTETKIILRTKYRQQLMTAINPKQNKAENKI